MSSEKIRTERVVVRRSPRYLRFALLGAIVGLIVALVLTLAWPEDPTYTQLQVFGFLGLISIVVFGTIGLVVALLLDRYFSRRTAAATAEHITVGEPAKVAPKTAANKPAPKK